MSKSCANSGEFFNAQNWVCGVTTRCVESNGSFSRLSGWLRPVLAPAQLSLCNREQVREQLLDYQHTAPLRMTV